MTEISESEVGHAPAEGKITDQAIVEARARKRAIIWGMGGHVIKCGLAPVLIDLMRRGYATVFAMNGSAAIHDFEIALAGHTSEDVEAVLPDGRFGAAEETGREMNSAISGGEAEGLGMGEALGRWLELIAPKSVFLSMGSPTRRTRSRFFSLAITTSATGSCTNRRDPAQQTCP